MNCIILFCSLFLNLSDDLQNPDPIPEHIAFEIDSKEVGEVRVINVWTPPSYNESNTAYPVMYMADGGIKEDFPHIANTLKKLVQQKSIPPVILVGIENTDRRRDLSGPSRVKKDARYCPLTDGAAKFRSFITKELMPEIETKYRTTEKKGLLGESLSGLFVVETMLLNPSLFDYYIAMDPSIWWNKHFLVKNASELLVAFPEKEVKLWFAGSGAIDISKYTNELKEVLNTDAPRTLTWKYCDQPNEAHNTIFRATKEKALIWTLND